MHKNHEHIKNNTATVSLKKLKTKETKKETDSTFKITFELQKLNTKFCCLHRHCVHPLPIPPSLPPLLHHSFSPSSSILLFSPPFPPSPSWAIYFAICIKCQFLLLQKRLHGFLTSKRNKERERDRENERVQGQKKEKEKKDRERERGRNFSKFNIQVLSS